MHVTNNILMSMSEMHDGMKVNEGVNNVQMVNGDTEN